MSECHPFLFSAVADLRRWLTLDKPEAAAMLCAGCEQWVCLEHIVSDGPDTSGEWLYFCAECEVEMMAW